MASGQLSNRVVNCADVSGGMSEESLCDIAVARHVCIQFSVVDKKLMTSCFDCVNMLKPKR